jgi:geranylgeranyl diphosphate synthase type II
MSLHEYMDELRLKVDEYLIDSLKRFKKDNPLFDAMHYSVKYGGKRLRPVLLLMLLESFNIEIEAGMSSAVALEMIHTYSLIHDDLPAMDDDDMRRGKPTNHKIYGEALAILAGDALLTDAFRMIAEDPALDAGTKIELVMFLSASAGSTGMIAGQVLDIEAEKNTVGLDALKKIHQLKTGRLIEFAAVAAGLISKQPLEVMANLSAFAQHLGLAFQIKDDILDVEGDTNIIGKAVGSDESRGKSTYVSLLGLTGAKEMLAIEIANALKALDELPVMTERLKDLTLYVGNRDN